MTTNQSLLFFHSVHSLYDQHQQYHNDIFQILYHWDSANDISSLKTLYRYLSVHAILHKSLNSAIVTKIKWLSHNISEWSPYYYSLVTSILRLLASSQVLYSGGFLLEILSDLVRTLKKFQTQEIIITLTNLAEIFTHLMQSPKNIYSIVELIGGFLQVQIVADHNLMKSFYFLLASSLQFESLSGVVTNFVIINCTNLMVAQFIEKHTLQLEDSLVAILNSVFEKFANTKDDSYLAVINVVLSSGMTSVQLIEDGITDQILFSVQHFQVLVQEHSFRNFIQLMLNISPRIKKYLKIIFEQ